MSFSPDIDELGLAHANVFAWSTYTVSSRPPYPGMFFTTTGGTSTIGLDDLMVAAGEPNISLMDFTQEPLVFPTLEMLMTKGSAGGGADYSTIGAASLEGSFSGALFGGDYLTAFNSAIINNMPNVSAGTSWFLDWRTGFGSGISNVVYSYQNGPPGSSDSFVGRIQFERAIVGSVSETQRETLSVMGYNCEEATDYIENQMASSPYVTFVVTRTLAGAFAYSLVGGGSEGNRTQSFQQVLYNTSVTLLGPLDQLVYNSDGSWAKPSSSTITQQEMPSYPKVYTIVPTSEGSFTGNLKLYEATFQHKYESSYKYVKDDIKSRFKTSSIIRSQRNTFVDEKTESFAASISSTVEVPKGFRTRRQASPKITRASYTTFGEDASITTVENTTTSATTPGAMSTGMGGMGGSSGGSY